MGVWPTTLTNLALGVGGEELPTASPSLFSGADDLGDQGTESTPKATRPAKKTPRE